MERTWNHFTRIHPAFHPSGPSRGRELGHYATFVYRHVTVLSTSQRVAMWALWGLNPTDECLRALTG